MTSEFMINYTEFLWSMDENEFSYPLGGYCKDIHGRSTPERTYVLEGIVNGSHYIAHLEWCAPEEPYDEESPSYHPEDESRWYIKKDGEIIREVPDDVAEQMIAYVAKHYVRNARG